MKKFYKTVSCRKTDEGYAICLDGKPIHGESGQPLCVPTQRLADSVVEEWARQSDEINPDTMPLTQLLKTAQDRVGTQRPAMEDKVLSYLDTDLICYRAVNPPAVAERQAQYWDRWLAWFANRFGAPLETTQTIGVLTQTKQAHAAVTREITALDDLRFTVLQLVTMVSSSLVLALAFTDQALSPDELFEAIFVEELYKAEVYNEAEHGFAPATEKQHTAVKRDLSAARAFLMALD